MNASACRRIVSMWAHVANAKVGLDVSARMHN